VGSVVLGGARIRLGIGLTEQKDWPVRIKEWEGLGRERLVKASGEQGKGKTLFRSSAGK